MAFPLWRFTTPAELLAGIVAMSCFFASWDLCTARAVLATPVHGIAFGILGLRFGRHDCSNKIGAQLSSYPDKDKTPSGGEGYGPPLRQSQT